MGFFQLATIVALTAIATKIIPVVFKAKLRHEIGGTVAPGFELVERVFKQNFDNNWDHEGAAFAVCYKGEMVVDLWGGFADSAADRRWQKDTMSIAFSTTKGVCALAVALLVDRGQLNYDDLVIKHWPEFGKNGKESVTIKQLLNHQAGLVHIDERIDMELVKDWRRMSKIFEDQKPNWDLSAGFSGYHIITFGWLMDQLVRRVDPKHRSIGLYIREEIALPFKLDFYLGLPMSEEHRVARLTLPTIVDYIARAVDLEFLMFLKAYFSQSSDALFKKAASNPLWLSVEKGINVYNNPELHALEIGSANGIATAGALAKLYCLLDSEKFLKKSTSDQLMKPVMSDFKDYVLGLNVSRGFGFFHSKNPDGNWQMGHHGYGGQNSKYDPQYHVSFAYLRNGLAPDFGDSNWSFAALQNAVYESIKRQQKPSDKAGN